MLEEISKIKSVEVLLVESAVNVCWTNQILKDGAVIAENLQRACYTEDRKSQFLAEVEGAANYVSILGWV